MKKYVSDEELVRCLEHLAAKEHLATVELLHCLGDLDQRKSYLKFGHSSLFALCTRKLKYSEPAAYRRICSARIIRKYPQAISFLENREVSLTTLTLVYSVLTPENANEIFKSIAGQSKEKVETIVAFQKTPLSPKRDTVRVISAQRVPAPVIENKQSSPSLLNQTFVSTFSGESKTTSSVATLAVATNLKFKINFEAGENFTNKLKRLRELKPYKNLEEIFETLIDEYLKRNAPENKKLSNKPSTSRFATTGLRATVLKRDNYQCSFIGQNGERCSCRMDLEIDHIDPVFLGGKTELSNLRTLCAAHNQFEAKRMLEAASGGLAT